MTPDVALVRAHERRIQRCRSCHANIVWFKTSRGKRMPVNAETVEPSDAALDMKKHVSHFATCPNAKQHRRRA